MATSGKQSKSTKNESANASEQSEGQMNVGATASEAVGQVQETVTGLKDQVKEQASTQLMARLESVTNGLETASKLLRTASDTVRGQDKAGIADSIAGVADRLETWSISIREQDVDKLIEETKQVAQKQPALFVGGAATLGFLATRFLTSSAKKQEEASSKQETASSNGSSSDSVAASGTSPSTEDVTSSIPPMTDLPDLPVSSLPGEGDLDYTDAYLSTEENSALDASLEAPLGSEDVVVFEEEIIVPDFDDPIPGTDSSSTSREGR